MTGYRVKGRPLLRYSTRGNTRLQALNKGLEERLGGKTLLAEQKGVNVTFKVLVHKFLEKIKHESYFH